MKRPWNNPIKSLNGKLMPVPRGLTLLGIKLYPVEDSDSQKNKVSCMQKSLFGSNDWFYFYKGVKIKRNEDKRLEAKLPDGIFDPDFFLYRSHKLKDNADLTKNDFLSHLDILQHAQGQGLQISEEECEAIRNEFLGISNEVDVVKTYRLEEYNVFVNNNRTPFIDKKFEFHDIDLNAIRSNSLREKFLKIKQVPMLAITSTQLSNSETSGRLVTWSPLASGFSTVTVLVAVTAF